MLAAFAFVPAAQAHRQRDHRGHHGHHGHHGHGHKAPRTTVRNIVQHQRALQNIADMNGGTRYTKTPGFTASVAYVRERMQRAGLNTKVVQFDMPDWQENAPPVLQQLTPTDTTYTPGTEADDNNPAVDFIAFAYSPTKAIRAARSCRRTTSWSRARRRTRHQRLRAGDFPAATAGAISLIQRGTCAFAKRSPTPRRRARSA